MPAVYGFAFGHVCGLLFRKLVVASGIAMMLGGVAAAGWGPSLLAGGVRHWQVWLPAAAVLLTGRLLMRSWAAENTAQRQPLLKLTGGLAAAMAIFAVALGYRVLQVPDAPTEAEDAAFVATLPSYDENVGGREFRMATERFVRTLAAIHDPTWQADLRRRPRIDERLDTVLQSGWQGDPELAAWLDRVYSEPPINPEDKPWPVLAMGAASKPVGVYDPPQLVKVSSTTASALDNARRMAQTLLGARASTTVAGRSECLRPRVPDHGDAGTESPLRGRHSGTGYEHEDRTARAGSRGTLAGSS